MINTMLAGCTGTFGAILYMWAMKGKPDASMSGNGLLAGLVAITAPSGFVNSMGAAIIGLVAGVLVCLSCAFVENHLKIDDPVGAISVHGANGLWGVLSIGFFADGTSNYGGSWNGVTGSVTGLFYGDSSQLVAQIVGCATLVGFVFSFSFVLNWILDVILGQRVSIATEVAGLDLSRDGTTWLSGVLRLPSGAGSICRLQKRWQSRKSFPSSTCSGPVSRMLGPGQVGSVPEFRFACGIFLKQQVIICTQPCCAILLKPSEFSHEENDFPIRHGADRDDVPGSGIACPLVTAHGD